MKTTVTLTSLQFKLLEHEYVCMHVCTSIGVCMDGTCLYHMHVYVNTHTDFKLAFILPGADTLLK